MMDVEAVKKSYQEFQQKNPGFGELLVLTKEGTIILATDPGFAKEEETKQLMDAWLNNKPAVEIGGIRFSVLKWDPIQFAARNVGPKGALIGSIAKSNNYAVIHLSKDCPTPLLAATVSLNRWAWGLV